MGSRTSGSADLIYPDLIVHCDWSTSPRKRWFATARRSERNTYYVGPPQPVGPLANFFQRMRAQVTVGPILAGFDFPIGVPRTYAERAGIIRFVDVLPDLGVGRWTDFYALAESADQISLTRPFYPRTSGGRLMQDLIGGLGLASAEQLLRTCDHATANRGQACAMFWTLGASQVGRAAISGWRDLLAPALRCRDVKLWPFDGELSNLLQPGHIVAAETYPSEVYSHLGIERNFGKRNQGRRQEQSEAILFWCNKNRVVLDRIVELEIREGFGESKSGEDPFDTVVGLLGMIEVVQDRFRFETPVGPAIRNIEGWILGMRTDSEPVPIAQRWSKRPKITANSEPQLTSPPADVPMGRGRLCPACGKKRFASWPLGWDAHAAHTCTGVTGGTPEERKRVFREIYLR